MRTFMIAAIIAVLAVPAHAQMGHSKGGGKLGQKSDEQLAAEQQKKKNEENAYKDAAQENSRCAGQAKGPLVKHALNNRGLGLAFSRRCSRGGGACAILRPGGALTRLQIISGLAQEIFSLSAAG